MVDGQPMPKTAEMPEAFDHSEAVPALRVQDAGLKGLRGWAFRHVTFDAHAGRVTTVTGPAGTGRSTLLLACAGRMKLTEGSVDVPTRTHHKRHVRAKVNVARIGGIIGLDTELSVAGNINDAADWAGMIREEARVLLSQWRRLFDLDLPAQLPAGELPALEFAALHLLCAALGDPRVIVLDDLDNDLTRSQINTLWQIASRVARGEVSDPMALVVSTVAAQPPPEIGPTIELARFDNCEKGGQQ